MDDTAIPVSGCGDGRFVDHLVARRPLRELPPRKLPWDDAEFSARMLREHLDQTHDAASRRLGTIDAHVDWIHQVVLEGRPGIVVDLGCGPGLYTERLAQLGCTCTGIDVSPAAIAHARRVADDRELACTYVLGDVRIVDVGAGHDLEMCLFGEFNTFGSDDAAGILSRAARRLRPGGTILLEAHTHDSVVEEGNRRSDWYTSTGGLFSDRPHLVLREHEWDESTAAAHTRIHVIEDTGAFVDHAEVLYAYTDDEYRGLLTEAGFGQPTFTAGMGTTVDPAMIVITAHTEVDRPGGE